MSISTSISTLRHIKFWRYCAISISLLSTGACQSHYPNEPTEHIELPETWQYANEQHDVQLSWNTLVNSQALNHIVLQALEHNEELKRKQLDVSIAEASLYSAKMNYIPTLNANFNASRRKQTTGSNVSTINNQFSLSADLSYELDIWGKLSDEKRSAALSLAAAQADYDASRRRIIRQTATAWASVLENQQLTTLGKLRVKNLARILSIIESGYRSGLNTALEVYLARNESEREHIRLIRTEQTLSDARRALALLLGGYPNNTYSAPETFPKTDAVIPPALPSELLMRRPDLQATWLQVLQQNAELGIAHKSRFPSLRLTASSGKNSNELSTLLDSGNPIWSVAGSLIQPLFAAGRLKSTENIAKLRLQQNESRYSQAVYEAFRDVESALEKQYSLEQEYQYTLQSRDNAINAETLSFEQYTKGLVNYSTVLDSQRRAVDAEINLISLKRQILVNKVNLHEAVSGELDFILPSKTLH